jgi:hypothetical protein
MPMTAEQSYALGSKQGRDRINQQLRANPQYTAFLQSIGATPGRLTDQQRKQAADWAGANLPGGIGGLEVDPTGNLNVGHGFAEELKQWGPVAAAAGGIAAPYLLPMLLGTGGTAAGGTLASSSIPSSLSMYGPAAIASQGVSAGVPLAVGGAATGGAVSGAVGGAAGQGIGLPTGGSTFNQLVGARPIPGMGSTIGGPANIASQGASQSGGGMGLWSNIQNAYDKYKQGKSIYDDIASAYGGGASQASQAMASNRGEKLAAQMDLEDLMMRRDRDYLQRQILRETEGRESASDAFRKLGRTQAILSPAARPNADNPYAAALRQATADERTGASALSAEVMKRLTGGNPIPEQVLRALDIDKSLMDPSGAEKFLGYTGAASRALGSRNRPIYVQSASDYAENYGR